MCEVWYWERIRVDYGITLRGYPASRVSSIVFSIFLGRSKETLLAGYYEETE